MIRVAHIADTHIKEGDRFEDTLNCLDVAIADGIANQVNLWIHAGDVFDRKSTPEERNAWAERLQRMAEHAPAVICRGNHDAHGDLDVFARLEAIHPIHVFDRPGFVDLAGVRVIVLPHVEKSNLHACLPEGTSVVDANATAADHIRVLLHWVAMMAAEFDGPTVLVSHLTVAGSMLSTGQPLVGHWGIELSAGDLEGTGCDYVALGHIHKAQEFASGRIRYAGSISRGNFGEVEEKGYNLVALSGKGAMPTVQARLVPARPMVLIEGDWDAQFKVFQWSEQVTPSAIRGADVRVRARFGDDVQPLAMEALTGYRQSLEAMGANQVKVEPVVTATVRVRSTEITAAVTPQQKLEAYWVATERPNDETAKRLLSKLSVLTEEVSRAAA